MISDGWVSERLREAAKRLPGVAKRLPGQADLLGVQPDVVGAGVCIFSKVSAASSSRPARASASAYQNVHSENVRSSPRNPSGDAPGLYRFTRLSETSVESIASSVESHIGSDGETKPCSGISSSDESST